MSKFSKNFCGKSPVKQYKEDVIINDSNAAENLKKLEYSRIGDGSMDPAITKEHVQKDLENFNTNETLDTMTSYSYPEKGNPAITMLGTGVEYVAGGGGLIKGLVRGISSRLGSRAVANTGFNLSKSRGAKSFFRNKLKPSQKRNIQNKSDVINDIIPDKKSDRNKGGTW